MSKILLSLGSISIAVLLFTGTAQGQTGDYGKVWVQGETMTFTTSFGGIAPQNRRIDSFNFPCIFIWVIPTFAILPAI